jgi:hypothetical protein
VVKLWHTSVVKRATFLFGNERKTEVTVLACKEVEIEELTLKFISMLRKYGSGTRASCKIS